MFGIKQKTFFPVEILQRYKKKKNEKNLNKKIYTKQNLFNVFKNYSFYAPSFATEDDDYSDGQKTNDDDDDDKRKKKKKKL